MWRTHCNQCYFIHFCFMGQSDISITPFQYGTQSRHKIPGSTVQRAHYRSMIELGTLKADYMIMNHSTEKIHLNDELF